MKLINEQSMNLDFVFLFYKVFKKKIDKMVLFNNLQLSVSIDRNYLCRLLYILKKSMLWRFESLIDLFGVDWLSRKARFEVFYNIYSYIYNIRLFINIQISINQTVYLYGEGVESVVSIFPNANWLEREVWDMFGLYFYNHPDLRRILTDYGFSGFPLRKDFPLSGYKEIRYDDTLKLIVTENLRLAQEFRVFTYNNPWI